MGHNAHRYVQGAAANAALASFLENDTAAVHEMAGIGTFHQLMTASTMQLLEGGKRSGEAMRKCSEPDSWSGP
jgi:hypothetical protein